MLSLQDLVLTAAQVLLNAGMGDGSGPALPRSSIGWKSYRMRKRTKAEEPTPDRMQKPLPKSQAEA